MFAHADVAAGDVWESCLNPFPDISHHYFLLGYDMPWTAAKHISEFGQKLISPNMVNLLAEFLRADAFSMQG